MASRGAPDHYEKWLSTMDLGGGQVTVCTLGLLSKRRCLCLFLEINYGLPVSTSEVLDFFQKLEKFFTFSDCNSLVTTIFFSSLDAES